MLDLFFDLAPMSLFQSLILGLVALGIMIPFRLLDFADLSAEGTYPLGGAITGLCLTYGFLPETSVLLAILGGGVGGLITAQIHLKLKIHPLLSGIILATLLYSVNLRLMGQPNIALFAYDTLYSAFENDIVKESLLTSGIDILILILLYGFLKTQKGLRLRAVGLNLKVAEIQGISITLYVLLGLFLANGCHALSGSLMVQTQGYSDINMGLGIVIYGLAALMLGETLLRRQTLKTQLMAPFLGSIVFSQLQGVVMAMGLEPSDFKFFTGTVLLSVLASQRWLFRNTHSL
ncbi:ABC transporter permease [Candidatus Bealeia paramacronuclearis]|uniref:ABC transporter permease n=1 Tax=Candidatus Bealeia paramacronuclearis TaxID=1921001 RepID=A0ABZ2C4P0_9PROT|nr:ABC transporter permease [Candidatus Bealeia paramacronuclearis]